MDKDDKIPTDMICANIGMGLFIGNSAWNIHVPMYKYLINSCYLTGGVCYMYGSHQHEKRNQYWFLYHGAIHAMMWIGHFLNVCDPLIYLYPIVATNISYDSLKINFLDIVQHSRKAFM